jgi:hypothetical protein
MLFSTLLDVALSSMPCLGKWCTVMEIEGVKFNMAAGSLCPALSMAWRELPKRALIDKKADPLPLPADSAYALRSQAQRIRY